MKNKTKNKIYEIIDGERIKILGSSSWGGGMARALSFAIDLQEYGSLNLEQAKFMDNLINQKRFNNLGFLEGLGYPITYKEFFVDKQNKMGFVVKYMQLENKENEIFRTYGDPIILQEKHFEEYFKWSKKQNFWDNLTNTIPYTYITFPVGFVSVPMSIIYHKKKNKILEKDSYFGKNLEFLMELYEKK